MPGLLHSGPRRVVRPSPAVFVIEGVPEGAEGLLPARRRDVEAVAGLQVAPSGEDVDVSAAAVLAVQNGGPGVSVALQSRPGRLLEGVQDRLDLLVGGSVLRGPGDHAGGAPVLERQRVGDGGHHVRVPAQRALACHPARSASLGRIFTHTARPALMTRRWRWGGLRGHSPPPAPPSGDTGIGSAMGWMNLNYASPPAFTSRLVCYPSTFGDPKGNILRMSSAIDFNPVGREKAADAIAPIPGLMEAPAAPREVSIANRAVLLP